MTLDLQTVLPNTPHSLDGSGFIFGSGTSLEAGYPMMPQLTRDIVKALNPTDRAVLDDVLVAADSLYVDATASPNIEQLADLVIAHAINSGDKRFTGLETRLRELVLERLLSVTNPSLDNHCRF